MTGLLTQEALASELLSDIEEVETLEAPIGFWEGFAAGSAIATAFVAGLMFAAT